MQMALAQQLQLRQPLPVLQDTRRPHPWEPLAKSGASSCCEQRLWMTSSQVRLLALHCLGSAFPRRYDARSLHHQVMWCAAAT